MQEGGSALMGTGIGRGDNRATEAAQQAIASPLLDNVSIAGATGVLLNITGGPDMTLGEVYQISEIIHDAAGSDAEIIFGAVHEPAMGGEIRVTVIATGFDSAHNSAVPGVINSQGQQGKGSPVIPFPAQRQAGAARVTRGIQQAGTGTDGLRRVTQSPGASSLADKQVKQDAQDQDLGDMEIPTFIRRQMD
jgi:cell division protein FtsZ